MTSQVDDRTRLAGSDASSRNAYLGQRLLAGGGLLGAVAASSCCLVPLALFGIGVGGAWIGYLTRLAPLSALFSRCRRTLPRARVLAAASVEEGRLRPG